MSPWVVAVVALGLACQWLTMRHLGRREFMEPHEGPAGVQEYAWDEHCRQIGLEAIRLEVEGSKRRMGEAKAKAEAPPRAAPAPTYSPRCTWVRGQGDDWITEIKDWRGACAHDPHVPCPRTGVVAAIDQPKQAYPVTWGAATGCQCAECASRKNPGHP